jgi:hypothetical protein
LCQCRSSRFLCRTNQYVFVNNMCHSSTSNVVDKDFQALSVHFTTVYSQMHYMQ